MLLLLDCADVFVLEVAALRVVALVLEAPLTLAAIDHSTLEDHTAVGAPDVDLLRAFGLTEDVIVSGLSLSDETTLEAVGDIGVSLGPDDAIWVPTLSLDVSGRVVEVNVAGVVPGVKQITSS